MHDFRANWNRRTNVLEVSVPVLLFLALFWLATLIDSKSSFRQTVGGYTVTIQPVYADANRIVLTYQVTGINQANGSPPPFPVSRWDGPDRYAVRLTDQTGHEFPLSYSVYGWVVNGQHLPSWMNLDAEGKPLILAFDPSDLDTLPATLDLHMVFDVATFVEGDSLRGVRGPFVFDFSMATDPVQRVANIQQTVTTPEDTVTLERVVFTRHETRAFLRFDSPNSHFAGYGRYADLTYGAWSAKQDLERYGMLGSGTTDYLPEWRLGFRAVGTSLMDVKAELTLTVWYSWMANRVEADHPGAVFHFTVPR